MKKRYRHHRRARGLAGLFGDMSKGKLLVGAAAVAFGAYYLFGRKAKAEEAKKAVLSEGLPAAKGGMPVPGFVKSGTQVKAPDAGAADKVKTVSTGESWSKIAKDSYGDYRWWPFLWDYNRSSSTQLENPDNLLRGTTIKIPALPMDVDGSFKKAIFARAENHLKAYRLGRRGSLPASVLERTPVPTA